MTAITNEEMIEDRLTHLEHDITEIKAMLPQFSTKADLAELKAEMIKWIVGTMIAAAAVGITVMTFVLNNAIPKSSNQPIVITVPR